MHQGFYFILPIATIGCLLPLSSQAQIAPDGSTSTTVNQDGNNFTIEQGDRLGDNLFHSFNEFSVPTLGSAVFINAGDIANIFSRVTGSNISSIDGLLGANGTANLFLINPNGIIFGENARLDLGGSFFASTADSLLFDGDTEFSAVNPQATPLLEVSIPIGARFRDNPGNITNRSFVQNSAGEFVGLEVAPGKNITLLGGNINFEAGEVTASGGSINLGGLFEEGIVDLDEDSSLKFPQNLDRANISLSNAADIDVRGMGGGNININGANVELTTGSFGSSQLRAGILANSTIADAQAGNITINATENFTLDKARIFNIIEPEAVGNGGGSDITAANVIVTNGGQMLVRSFGEGNAGNISIDAAESVTLDGIDPDFNLRSTIFNTSEASGNGGNIKITTTSLRLTDGGRINASTFGDGDSGNIDIQVESLSLENDTLISANTLGSGNAGEVTIKALNFVSLDASAIATITEPGAEGNSGKIEINTTNLSVANESLIDVSSLGRGNAGEIIIDATDNLVVQGANSVIFSEITPNAQGTSGGIKITAGNLSLIDGGALDSRNFSTGSGGTIDLKIDDSLTITGIGEEISDFSQITTETFGEGDAGNIQITTQNLSVENGGVINSSTSGKGNGGKITIDVADNISLGSENPEESISQIIVSSFGASGTFADRFQSGDAGDINIQAQSLSLRNGSSINSNSVSVSPAQPGDILIAVQDSIILSGESKDGSGSSINTDTLGTGEAGNIELVGNNLSLINGAEISSSNSLAGFGSGGNITINIEDSVVINGNSQNGNISGITTNISGAENAGNIKLRADSLFLEDSAQISSNVVSSFVNSSSGEGGNIALQLANILLLGNNSMISAQASKNANGGNVIIGIEEGFILAFTNQNNDIVANAAQGRGGEINIDTQGIFGIEERPLNSITNDINASSEVNGFDGTIDINNPAVDPTIGLIELPASVGDASDQISQNPCEQGVGSEFTITGKGGLPPNANEALNRESPQVGLIESVTSQQNTVDRNDTPSTAKTNTEAVPAQGWIFNENGEVTLTANETTNMSIERSTPRISCNASNLLVVGDGVTR